MVKMNFTNNQTAFEYALYMIAASYFDKAICQSRMMERNMLLQYKEQKQNTQYQMEEICIDFMEGLVRKLPPEFFNRTVEVKLNKTPSGLTEVVFLDNESIIAFRAKYAGRRTKIDIKIWRHCPRHNKAA